MVKLKIVIVNMWTICYFINWGIFALRKHLVWFHILIRTLWLKMYIMDTAHRTLKNNLLQSGYYLSASVWLQTIYHKGSFVLNAAINAQRVGRLKSLYGSQKEWNIHLPTSILSSKLCRHCFIHFRISLICVDLLMNKSLKG